uniref:F5/8 type C domain-containing protein n=1 Tax=Panagrellus redivivus TaxID=6233 RepID=A0A7E4V4F9_PANRE
MKGSRSDQWCAKKLIPLLPQNPVIEVKEVRGVLEFYVNSDVWVELYYTESIDLNTGYLEPITPIGYGSSKAGGELIQALLKT